MSHGSRSPICWAHKLRAYGKAIKDTTTSLGHIDWWDDGETLSYKEFRLSMSQLRSFVLEEIRLSQHQLDELMLIHLDENRADIIPHLSLRSLQDNSSESAPGWSFINHPKNESLRGYERWLPDRILNNTWLRKDFFG